MPGQRLVVPEVYEWCLAIPGKQHATGRAKLADRAGNDCTFQRLRRILPGAFVWWWTSSEITPSSFSSSDPTAKRHHLFSPAARATIE